MTLKDHCPAAITPTHHPPAVNARPCRRFSTGHEYESDLLPAGPGAP